MVDDQRFAGYRPDVLVYETDPLTEDLTIAGPISPHLKIASSGTDSDFDVKLIDVYPDEDPDTDHGPEQTRARCIAAAHGRLRAIAARGAFPGEVPHKLGEAGAAGAWQGNRSSISPCPISITPSAAVIASWSRFRVRGFRSLTAIRKPLPTFPMPRRRNSRRPPKQVFHQKDAASGVNVLVLPQQLISRRHSALAIS